MQKEFFGYDSIQNVKEILDDYDARKIFLVTGKKAYTLSGAEKKLNPFLRGRKTTIFNDFSPNPNITEVKEGIELYKQTNPDLVIAVGGGSVIDMGKTVNILSHHEKQPEKYVKGEILIEKPGKPFIAVPTTSGTGSEATYFATLYINKIKYSFGDKRFTLPNYAIIDPQFTRSMPKYLTASTGLDALCQGIESIWAVGSTDESRKYARIAIENAFNNLEKVVNDPDKTSRLNMAKAAHLSGKAINISKTTACHSISYPITSYFGIAHGHAVALTMPQIIEFNSGVSEKDCNDKRGEDFVKDRLNEIINLMGCEDAVDAKTYFQDLMEKIGVSHRLNKLNISQKDIELIIEKGFTPDRMDNNPRIMTREHIEKIMDEIK